MKRKRTLAIIHLLKVFCLQILFIKLPLDISSFEHCLMRFSQKEHLNSTFSVTESVSKVNHVFRVFCVFLYLYLIIPENLEIDGQSGHSDGAMNVDHCRGDDATVHYDDLEIL